jgi:uncharacterized protein YdeI (YjbR/CyaY-like superfamily)
MDKHNKSSTVTYNGITTFHTKTRKEWRRWLEKYHHTAKSAWLIIYKKEAATKSVTHLDAIEVALYFGWIDNKSNKRDSECCYYNWSHKWVE